LLGRPRHRGVSRLPWKGGNQAGHPGQIQSHERIRHAKKDYKKRNVIERCFGQLKDFKRIATRYDKLAQNFFLPSASSLP
jgi:transposase